MGWLALCAQARNQRCQLGHAWHLDAVRVCRIEGLTSILAV